MEQMKILMGDYQTNEKKIIKSIGKLLELVFSEPFLDPYFKDKPYEWEEEWRIVRSKYDLNYDSINNRYYLQLEPKNIKRVWFSSKMDPAHFTEYVEYCNKYGIQYDKYELH